MIAERLEQLMFLFRYGMPKRKITSETLLENLSLIERPVFFLSTGRTGTMWFTEYLERYSNVGVLHSPKPNLSMSGKFLFENYIESGDIEQLKKVSNAIYSAGRDIHLRQIYKCNKRYIETNNYVTFFAYGLAELFPDSIFIHLHRNPCSFIRSGINRGWYDYNNQSNARLLQRDDEKWNLYSQAEKIAWLWAKTNNFILKFMNTIDGDRQISLSIDELDSDNVAMVISFIGLEYRPELDYLFKIKTNKNRLEKIPKDYLSIKSEIESIVGPVSHKLNYSTL